MSKDVDQYAFWPNLGIAIDQLLNVFPCFGYADETLSARAYRASKNNRYPGKLLMPLIDVLFLWQKPDDEVNALAGEVVRGHCRRAYHKEALRRSLPPEYRNADSQSH